VRIISRPFFDKSVLMNFILKVGPVIIANYGFIANTPTPGFRIASE